MRPVWRERALFAVAACWLVLGVFWTPAAAFSIDGFVYQAMTDAAARMGSFFIENGYETYRSPALATTLIRPHDGLLAPQYPGLWGFVTAPAYLLGGLRGLIIFQSLCGILSLFFVWRTALALTEDRRRAADAALIFSLAGFYVVYVAAVWPHAAAMACVTFAMMCVAMSEAKETRRVLLAGLALGLGVNLRVDAMFAAPALALWLLGFARRPYVSLAALVAGMAPGLAASTWVNYVKFGVAQPISYGAKIEGAAALHSYGAVAPFAAVGAVLALCLGAPAVRRLLARPATWAILVPLGLAAVAAIPAGRDVLLRFGKGLMVLTIDFQHHRFPYFDLHKDEHGVLYAFGLIKKALLQSLPFAPLALIPITGAFRERGRAVAFCLAVALIPAAPFLYHSWHGGLALNMRYLLPAVPAIAILTALGLARIRDWAGRGAVIPGAAILALLVYAMIQLQTPHPFAAVVQITLPNASLAATFALTLMTLALRGAARRYAAQTLHGAAIAGLLIAFGLGWLVDLRVTNDMRARNLGMARLTADLPADAALIAYSARRAALRLNRPPALTVQADFRTGEVQPHLADFVARMFAEGRPVFAQSRHLAEALSSAGVADPGPPRYGVEQDMEIYPMNPPEKTLSDDGS